MISKQSFGTCLATRGWFSLPLPIIATYNRGEILLTCNAPDSSCYMRILCFELSSKGSCQCVVHGVLFSTVSNWQTGSLLNFTELLELKGSSGEIDTPAKAESPWACYTGTCLGWFLVSREGGFMSSLSSLKTVPVFCHPQLKEILHVEGWKFLFCSACQLLLVLLLGTTKKWLAPSSWPLKY